MRRIDGMTQLIPLSDWVTALQLHYPHSGWGPRHAVGEGDAALDSAFYYQLLLSCVPFSVDLIGRDLLVSHLAPTVCNRQ